MALTLFEAAWEHRRCKICKDAEEPCCHGQHTYQDFSSNGLVMCLHCGLDYLDYVQVQKEQDVTQIENDAITRLRNVKLSELAKLGALKHEAQREFYEAKEKFADVPYRARGYDVVMFDEVEPYPGKDIELLARVLDKFSRLFENEALAPELKIPMQVREPKKDEIVDKHARNMEELRKIKEAYQRQQKENQKNPRFFEGGRRGGKKW